MSEVDSELSRISFEVPTERAEELMDFLRSLPVSNLKVEDVVREEYHDPVEFDWLGQ